MERSTLTEFAQSNPVTPPGYRAWLESIPEWNEVRTGWENGISQAQIRRWLIEECGYDPNLATRNRIAHLSKAHPRASRVRP